MSIFCMGTLQGEQVEFDSGAGVLGSDVLG